MARVVPHHGRWFEELTVGDVIPHSLTRTVTETDNVLVTTLTMNMARLHLDHQHAADDTEFGRPLVNSMFTLALLVGMSVLETTHGTTIANLGFEEVVVPGARVLRRHAVRRVGGRRRRASLRRARRRDRDVRAPGVQPGRHARLPCPAQRADAAPPDGFVSEPQPLWAPSAERVAGSRLTAFREFAAAREGLRRSRRTRRSTTGPSSSPATSGTRCGSSRRSAAPGGANGSSSRPNPSGAPASSPTPGSTSPRRCCATRRASPPSCSPRGRRPPIVDPRRAPRAGVGGSSRR